MKENTQNYIYNEVLVKLIYLTKRNNLSNSEIGDIIDVERRAINGRAKRNSKFKPEEIKKIEQHFNISLDDIQIVEKNKTELNPVQNDYINITIESWGKRLFVLQTTAGFNNTDDFSKFLDIPSTKLQDYMDNNTYPTLDDLLKIKSKFSKTSLDWLLFGITI